MARGDDDAQKFMPGHFGKNTSVIGLAANTTLDRSSSAYRWTDQGLVIYLLKKDSPPFA